MEKELPHPQVDLACGFSILNPREFISSMKSIVASPIYIALLLSTITDMPFISYNSSNF